MRKVYTGIKGDTRFFSFCKFPDALRLFASIIGTSFVVSTDADVNEKIKAAFMFGLARNSIIFQRVGTDALQIVGAETGDRFFVKTKGCKFHGFVGNRVGRAWCGTTLNFGGIRVDYFDSQIEPFSEL